MTLRALMAMALAALAVPIVAEVPDEKVCKKIKLCARETLLGLFQGTPLHHQRLGLPQRDRDFIAKRTQIDQRQQEEKQQAYRLPDRRAVGWLPL